MNAKQMENLLKLIIVLEVFRAFNGFVATPIYHGIKRHRQETETRNSKALKNKKPIVGFVGKYDPEEKL